MWKDEEINPYKTPKTNSSKEQKTDKNKSEIPVDVLSKIRGGMYACLILAFFSLTLIILLNTTNILGEKYADYVSFIDVGIYGLYALGIYLKSRTAAGFALLTYVLSRVFLFFELGSHPGLISIIFAYFLLMSIVGTFQYHNHKKLMLQAY